MAGKTSGGDSKATAAAATTPAAAAGNMTIPPFMAQNQGLLAAQLAHGFGGSPESYLQSPLMQLFQPMTFSPPSAASSGKSSSTSGDMSIKANASDADKTKLLLRYFMEKAGKA